MHVLFVCTGNICRSPLAERLAAAMGAEMSIRGFEVSSAGTRAVIAHPVHQEAARVLEALGGDPSNFSARQLTSRVAMNADLVIAMTRAHRDRVLELAPRHLRSAFTLTEAARLAAEAEVIQDLAALRPKFAARDMADIPDPIGQSAEVFSEVGSQIAANLPAVLELCERTTSNANR